jgi:hypothetical protein
MFPHGGIESTKAFKVVSLPSQAIEGMIIEEEFHCRIESLDYEEKHSDIKQDEADRGTQHTATFVQAESHGRLGQF